MSYRLGLAPTEGGAGAVDASLVGALTIVPRMYFPAQGLKAGGIEMPGFVFANYPFAGWLAIALLGWWFGSWYRAIEPREEARPRALRTCLFGAAVLLGAFVVQCAFDGYGNFGLARTDETLLRWLQVSKYPPSLAFVTLELGLGALLLAFFLRFDRPGRFGPLVVFGQSALFFYLVHVHLMELARGVIARGNADFARAQWFQPPALPLSSAWWATAGALVVLYPLCLWRRRARERARSRA